MVLYYSCSPHLGNVLFIQIHADTLRPVFVSKALHSKRCLKTNLSPLFPLSLCSIYKHRVTLAVEFSGRRSTGSFFEKKSFKNNYFFDWTFTDFHKHRKNWGIIIENKAHCAKVQKYEQGKISLQFFDIRC